MSIFFRNRAASVRHSNLVFCLLLPAEKGQGHLEASGNFPQGIDGGRGVPTFDLSEHGLADAGQGGRLLQSQGPFRPQLLQISAHR